MTGTTRRILVAVDLVAYRDVAFDGALRLGRAWNAEVTLLHAHPVRRVSRIAVDGQELERDRRVTERSSLRALVRAAEEQGVRVRVISAEGDPVRAIAAHAHLVMADLIVIARDFGSSRVWRTSGVAAAVGRVAPAPVLIVPSDLTTADSATLFRKLVVAVDFTVASAVAMRVAADVIAHSDGRATVVHVLPYQLPMVSSGSEAFGVIDDLQGQLAQAEERLRRAMPDAALRRMKPRVLAGAAERAILDVAAEADADLVVMGVPRRTRFDEFIFGSTFRKVVRRCLRPILAVPVGAGAYRWTGEPFAPAVGAGRLRAA